MADIGFKNLQSAKSAASTTYGYLSNLSAVCSGFSDIINDVSMQWDTTGMDKESFMTRLNGCLSNIEVCNEALNKLCNVILNYVDSATTISAVSLEIGGKVGTYKFSTGYDTAMDAVLGTNVEKLKTKYFSEKSEIGAFGIKNDDGSITKVTTEGMTIDDLVAEGYTTEQIAVSIEKDGVPQAWIPARDLLDSSNYTNYANSSIAAETNVGDSLAVSTIATGDSASSDVEWQSLQAEVLEGDDNIETLSSDYDINY